MNRGKITEKLIKFALMLIGRMPASLAQANIVASMFFGGVTGSAQADTSAIGGMLIPAMIKEGYSKEDSRGSHSQFINSRPYHSAEYHDGHLWRMRGNFRWSHVPGRIHTWTYGGTWAYDSGGAPGQDHAFSETH